MNKIAAVVWEDSVSEGLVKDFGPQVLLLRCVLDDLDPDEDFFAWRSRLPFGAIPANSNTKVLKRADEHGRGGGLVVAVFDFDRAFELLPQGDARRARRCKAEIKSFLMGARRADALRVFFVDRNIETLIDAVRALRQSAERGKPTPAERDKTLNNFAFGSAPDERAALRARVPSFDYMVRRFALLLRPPPS